MRFAGQIDAAGRPITMRICNEAQGEHNTHAEQFKAHDQKITCFDLGHPSEQLKFYQQQNKPENSFSKIATLGFPSIDLITGSAHRPELPKAANAEVSPPHSNCEAKPQLSAANNAEKENNQSRDLKYDKDGVPYEPQKPLPTASTKERFQYAADEMYYIAWCAANGGQPGHKKHQ